MVYQVIRPCSKSFNETKIQKAFFRVFATMLHNYDQYLIRSNSFSKENPKPSTQDLQSIEEQNNIPEVWFDNAGFLLSIDKDYRVFFSL